MNVTNPITQVVLVDDDPAQARLFDMILRNALGDQIHLVTFMDSREAAAYLDSHLIDVLITDLQMTHLDGLTLIRLARHRAPWAQILLMTASSTSGSLVEAADLGASDYLLKPFARDLLIDLVEQAQRRIGRWRTALAGTLHRDRPLAALGVG